MWAFFNLHVPTTEASRSAEIPSIIILIRGWETATVFTATAPSQKLVSYPTLADTLLPYDTAIYSFSSLLPTDAANSPQSIQLPSLSLLFPVWRNLFCGAHLFSVWEHKEAQIQLFTLIVCVTQTHAEPFIFKRNSSWRMCVVGNWKKV